jgi:hypothetical protein
MDALLKDYRAWLESELQLLGNASHHAYAFGQANMAQRALEQFDQELERTVYLPFDAASARGALTALQLIAQRETSLDPALERLREALDEAVSDKPMDE